MLPARSFFIAQVRIALTGKEEEGGAFDFPHRVRIDAPHKMKDLTIAIDGPAGAGKSTVARRVANELGLIYVDTGAMYRAITWKAIKNQIDTADEEGLTQLTRESSLELKATPHGMDIWLDGHRITEAVRSPEVTAHVSEVARVAGVREALVHKQRTIAQNTGVVMDGRDIGTQVLPNADLKVYLTASIEERARRRYGELVRNGFKVDMTQLQEEIRIRDETDANRTHSPLRPASDAIVLDSSTLSIEEVVEAILDLCRTKVGGGE